MKRKIIVNSLCVVMAFIASTALLNSCSSEKEQYAERVKEAFLKGWNAYHDYAWGMDAANPISKSGHNWYSKSLLMTPVDAYSTMCLMNLTEQKAEAKKLILDSLDFDCDMYVQQFEIAIRIMGGLLSAYQLDGDPRFLQLAEDLGKRMIPVFDSPTGMPYRLVNLHTGEVSGNVTNPCEIGSMLLEYGMLSKLTGNPEYYEKCKRGIVAVYERRGKTGLVGSNIDVETGEWTNRTSHISGGIDAYYEYLLKGWLLFNDQDLKDMWDEYKVAISKYLADDTETGFWYGYADMDSGERKDTRFCALDCFYGAVLCLDGDIETAKCLQESIFKMWNMYGVEPETIDYSDMTVLNGFYMVRPEAIEAAYYLWSFTGDKKYYEMGKTMFESIEKYCQVENGYVQIEDVRTMEKKDDLESFFFAETMKYCYLFFAPEGTFSFDKYVLNTEAHPMLKQ